MNIIQQLEQEQLRSDIPDFRAGDTVRVHAKVVFRFLKALSWRAKMAVSVKLLQCAVLRPASV